MSEDVVLRNFAKHRLASSARAWLWACVHFSDKLRVAAPEVPKGFLHRSRRFVPLQVNTARQSGVVPRSLAWTDRSALQPPRCRLWKRLSFSQWRLDYGDSVVVLVTETGHPLWPIELKIKVGLAELQPRAVGHWSQLIEAIHGALEGMESEPSLMTV